VHRRHDRPPSLRERVALSLLRTAAELAPQRRATVDRLIAQRPGMARDKALSDLAASEWTEQVLLWLGWRLLPADALPDRISSP
jgi:hypothetical protein